MGEALRHTPETFGGSASYEQPHAPQLRLLRPEPAHESLMDNDGPIIVGDSIYNSYDVGNEVHLLRKHRHLPGRRREHYVEQNLLKFVSEFAAEVPHQKIPGVITKDGSFDIAGFDMTHMTAETAMLEGAGPREKAEYIGMTRVTRLLQQGVANAENPEDVRVAWLSPSIDESTPYSMMFYFEVGQYDESLKGHPVTERVLRYNENYGDFRKSKQAYTAIQSQANQPWSAHTFHSNIDYLLNPVLLRGDQETDRFIIEDVIGIDRDSLHFTQEFENRVMHDLHDLIYGYTSLALAMADGRIEVNEATSERLKDNLGKIFYWSREIAERMKAREPLRVAGMYVEIHTQDAEEQYRRARDRGELVTENGSSCPVVKESVYAFAEKQTKLCCTCPLCGKKVEARIGGGKIKCPECKQARKWKKPQQKPVDTIEIDWNPLQEQGTIYELAA